MSKRYKQHKRFGGSHRNPTGGVPMNFKNDEVDDENDLPPIVATGTGQRCYHSHPPFVVREATEDKPEIAIYGGSCNTPAVADADVYIGFDTGMRRKMRWPWQKGPVEVFFPVMDMYPPDDPIEFKNLVLWTKDQLEAGKKVHAGCIGGHGRTGTFFAALVAEMRPDVDDAIGYVRDGYCERAVESFKQVEWLHKFFGVKKVKGYKEDWAAKPTFPSSGPHLTGHNAQYSESQSLFPELDTTGNSGTGSTVIAPQFGGDATKSTSTTSLTGGWKGSYFDAVNTARGGSYVPSNSATYKDLMGSTKKKVDEGAVKDVIRVGFVPHGLNIFEDRA